MNILNLRNVGSHEIPDSFRGILRISPNNGVDDPSKILTTIDSEVPLSNSEGKLLPITFIPKSFKTIVVSPDSSSQESIFVEKDLINIKQKYNNLYISNSLHICPSLYIKPVKNQVPIIISNGSSSLGYPTEAPDNKAYFNYNNKCSFSKLLSIDENIDRIPPTHEVYKNKEQWVMINGEYPQRYIRYNGTNYKVPFLKRREYGLGHIGLHHFKRSSDTTYYDLTHDTVSNKNGAHTQLSYIPIESLAYSVIESQTTGLYRSPLKGRYFQLNSTKGEATNTTSDSLAKILFGENILEENTTLNQNAPIMGVGVQTGTIHYNAIPAKHYFFHLARRYDATNKAKYLKKSTTNTISSAIHGNSSKMNNLIENYVLCDGKSIKTGYPHISIEEIDKKFETSAVYKAIALSTTKSNTDFNTPPLFEFDQVSPRFLRGLNWLRDDAKKLIPNTKKYKKIEDNLTDKANIAKDIREVSMYYSNSDSQLQSRSYKHAHLLFSQAGEEVNRVGTDGEGNNITLTDTLSNEKLMFQGLLDSELPENKQKWEDYVNGTQAALFMGTKMLKTTGSLRLYGKTFEAKKELQLQNYPISVWGGSNAYFHSQAGCIRFGKRHIGKCMNHRTRCQGPIKIRDGFYRLASCDANATSWRFLTSMPKEDKYDFVSNPLREYSKATDFNKTEFVLDNSLSSPPAINLIPLMKI